MKTLLQLFSLLMLTFSQYILAETPSLTPPADAEKTASGLSHKLLKAGTGDAMPAADDMVIVHYEGWLSNGTQFDSSVKRGQPVTFPLKQVIRGWAEGLQLMKVGEKRRLWIPTSLGYGDNPRPGAPKGDLIFDVELLAIKKPKPAPPAPENLTKPPASAKQEVSGLTSIVLKPGTGKINPKAGSVVKVHYSGWTSDGNLFDSSIVRDEPLIAPLNRVIRGWSQGIQLMTVGEKRRLWIPSNLAYGENPPNGAPGGQLVFDIELISILNL